VGGLFVCWVNMDLVEGGLLVGKYGFSGLVVCWWLNLDLVGGWFVGG
jgi:hypothetical protein